jgi:hypothetical protein
MIVIPKRIVVGEHGEPVEVILPWATFCEIAETLGYDLEADAETDLRETRRDLQTDQHEAFTPLSSL